MASPGNLSEDRKKVSEIVKYINLDSGQRLGFVAEIVSWETHSRPAAGEYAQAVISDQFPDDIDIFVGMMGTYFGTPTKRWGSGTEEEFRIAYESWEKTKVPEIMFYFSDAMPSLNQIDPEQLAKRNAFRSDLETLGVYYFTYTDITEFQFDLHNHISSAIHEVLKGKEVGRSEIAIPEESVNNLRNYDELLAKEPLIKANIVLNMGANHMGAYSDLLSSLSSDIVKFTRSLTRESKNIERATKNQKFDKVKISLNKIYDEMDNYSKSLISTVPKLSTEFSGTIMSGLRTIKIVKSNKLEDQMPLGDLAANVSGMRTGLAALIESITTSESGFAEWPDQLLDLKIRKQVVLELHKDLIASLRKSIELVDRFSEELAL